MLLALVKLDVLTRRLLSSTLFRQPRLLLHVLLEFDLVHGGRLGVDRVFLLVVTHRAAGVHEVSGWMRRDSGALEGRGEAEEPPRPW